VPHLQTSKKIHCHKFVFPNFFEWKYTFQKFFWQIILASVSKFKIINKINLKVFTLRTSKKRRQKCAKAWESVPKVEKVFPNMRKCAKAWSSMLMQIAIDFQYKCYAIFCAQYKTLFPFLGWGGEGGVAVFLIAACCCQKHNLDKIIYFRINSSSPNLD